MRWSYSCPHCASCLNPDETVVLVGEHGGVRALVGLHPEPGNYQVYAPPGIEIAAGSRWSFYCPVCQTSLVTEVSGGLCAIDGPYEGPKHRVYFSPVAGEHATFLVSAEGIVERHGDHAERHSLELLEQI